MALLLSPIGYGAAIKYQALVIFSILMATRVQAISAMLQSPLHQTRPPPILFA